MPMPNIRTMFIPDEGMVMADLDLDSADLRIVTWESDCKGMKALFREGKKPYLQVAREYYHDNSIQKKRSDGTEDPRYYAFKKLCHATNYLGKAPEIAGQCGLLVKEVERIQHWYFEMFPEIKRWQDAFVKRCIRTGTVSNAFGYKKKFYERIEGNILNRMVAWVPQSTVGILINHAYVNIDHNLPLVDILLQVHDSLTMQWPIQCDGDYAEAVKREATIVIPYPEPLVIPVGLKMSEKSWGDCQ
jgi:DNA polymerase I-like protein with 3'-5' exonuclease and polymerase domains